MTKNLDKLLNQPIETAGTGLSPEEFAQIAGQIEELKSLLDDPLTQLSDWEYEFIESVAIQYEESKTLSKKQLEHIIRLYEKYCA